MYFLLLAVAYAALNRLRGNGTVPKIVAYALFAVLLCVNAWIHGAALSAAQMAVLFAIGWAGTWWGFNHCWGKYFPDATDTSGKTCVPLVDKITNSIMGTYTSETPIPEAINWKTVAMSIRYLIFFAPKYVAVALLMGIWGVHTHDQAIEGLLIALFILALAGPTYRLGFWIAERKPQWNRYNVAFSELMIGAEFCIADGVSV